MENQTTSKSVMPTEPSLNLKDGSRVAVMGGGPAGSFFSYFLLDFAERLGIELTVDIYEPRDFSQPAPFGCNHCAGVISESLVQNLAVEGITLPTTVVQRAIDSYIMHTHEGTLTIATPSNERRIGTIFRGAGPRGLQGVKWHSFDGHLLGLAQERGAQLNNSRITGLKRVDSRIQVTAKSQPPEMYDLLAVASGVNTSGLKLFNQNDFSYEPPKTTKTAIREYYLGADVIERCMGHSLHVFLLDIPKLDFAMIIPKGDYVTICILGKDIDEDLVEALLSSPEVKSCFPEDWDWDQPACQCSPKVTTHGTPRPYEDRVVFIGDCGVTRLYKDGIGAAYRAAKAAAVTAIFEGISAEDFKRQYYPSTRIIENDNAYGRLIFEVTHLVQKFRFTRKGILSMANHEQQNGTNSLPMSSVLWDTFTGSAPYRNIFLRTLHPRFWSRLIWDLAAAIVDG